MLIFSAGCSSSGLGTCRVVAFEGFSRAFGDDQFLLGGGGDEGAGAGSVVAVEGVAVGLVEQDVGDAEGAEGGQYSLDVFDVAPVLGVDADGAAGVIGLGAGVDERGCFAAVADKGVSGAKPIAGNWDGLPDSFTRGVDATLNRRDQPNVGYFFKDDQYVRYDLDADRADSGYPKAIKGNWIFFS
nr:hemopexin repeat-containing protein [Streptomyces sp. NRRL F-5630]